MSAIGTTAVDLTGVDYATGVSGKGLLSYTGLSFVFHNEEIAANDNLPRYLDLGTYAEAQGIPYTQSSNLVAALDVALLAFEHPEEVYAAISNRARKVRKAVEQAGLTILASGESAADAIVTIALPKGLSAMQLGDNLFLNGFNVHYESAYLRERNWLQISCMNDVAEKELTRMLELLPLLTSSA